MMSEEIMIIELKVTIKMIKEYMKNKDFLFLPCPSLFPLFGISSPSVVLPPNSDLEC